MRIFLLPISTRRTLIYCERVQQQLQGSQPSIADRIVNKANKTWAGWEAEKTGWKKRLTTYGNEYVFSRIPFEEWGLKTLPSSTANVGVTEVLYPDLFLPKNQVPTVLTSLAKERQGLHKQRLIYSLIGLPFTIPVGLLPVIPNIPGFYLTFRAWSHYKALFGAKYLETLCERNLVKLTSCNTLNQMYASGLIHSSRDASRQADSPTDDQSRKIADEISAKRSSTASKDVLLLKRWNGKLLAEQFNLPGMELEIERAVEQVEKSLKEESDVDNASSTPAEAPKDR